MREEENGWYSRVRIIGRGIALKRLSPVISRNESPCGIRERGMKSI